jgi:phage virion morphogenesis protein
MNFTHRIDDHEVEELLTRLRQHIGDMKPTMTRIGAFYERSVLQNFRAESAPDGTPWQPLSAATLMMGLGKKKGWKKNGGLSVKGKRYLQGKKILRESGDLEGSVHFQAEKDSVTIGTSGSIPYDAIQQLGGKAGRGRKVTIPAREYLAMNEGAGLALAEQDRVWIMEMVREEIATWE